MRLIRRQSVRFPRVFIFYFSLFPLARMDETRRETKWMYLKRQSPVIQFLSTGHVRDTSGKTPTATVFSQPIPVTYDDLVFVSINRRDDVPVYILCILCFIKTLITSFLFISRPKNNHGIHFDFFLQALFEKSF